MTMVNERSDAAGYVGWFLFGTILGAATALLMTPRTGQETRDFLTEKGNDLARRAQSLASEAQDRAGNWLDKSREVFEEQTQRLMSAFEAGKEAMREEIRKAPTPPRV
jgi:gas vesicle protein